MKKIKTKVFTGRDTEELVGKINKFINGRIAEIGPFHECDHKFYCVVTILEEEITVPYYNGYPWKSPFYNPPYTVPGVWKYPWEPMTYKYDVTCSTGSSNTTYGNNPPDCDCCECCDDCGENLDNCSADDVEDCCCDCDDCEFNGENLDNYQEGDIDTSGAIGGHGCDCCCDDKKEFNDCDFPGDFPGDFGNEEVEENEGEFSGENLNKFLPDDDCNGR